MMTTDELVDAAREFAKEARALRASGWREAASEVPLKNEWVVVARPGETFTVGYLSTEGAWVVMGGGPVRWWMRVPVQPEPT